MKYQIYEGYLEELEKKVNRIQNKCKKYGCDFTFEKLGIIWKKVQVSWNPITQKGVYRDFRYIEVEADGSAIINDWEFIARIDHTPAGNIFAKGISDVEIPERYRQAKPYCEHCNSIRSRNNTFIVRNTKTGEFRQVGRNCLCDYTHGLSVEFATLMASMRDLFEEEASRGYCGSGSGRWNPHYETELILNIASEWVAHFGYQKTHYDNGDYNPDNTKRRVSEVVEILNGGVNKETKKLMDSVDFNHESESAKEMTQNVIDWISASDDTSDYMTTLKILVANKRVEYKHFGYLCSAVQSYKRSMEKHERIEREKKANAKSEYIGNVGERIELDIQSGTCVTGYNTDFGYIAILKFIDLNGNIIIWKTSNDVDADKVIHLKGTIKEHSEYNGIKQTVLTRCKVEERR